VYDEKRALVELARSELRRRTEPNRRKTAGQMQKTAARAALWN